jgi:cold-inducible RNA-binding protein
MKLYIGNLPKTVDDAQLKDLAAPFGTLLSANVATERDGGASKGFAFIEFGSDDEARTAMTALDGREVGGQTLKVNEAKKKASPLSLV